MSKKLPSSMVGYLRCVVTCRDIPVSSSEIQAKEKEMILSHSRTSMF